MNIFKNKYINNRYYNIIPVKVDTSKYLPLVLLGQDLFEEENYLQSSYVTNVKLLEKNDKRNNCKVTIEDYYSDVLFKSTLKSYKNRDIYLKSKLKDLLFYKTLNFSYRYSIYHIGLGSLISSLNNLEYKFEFGLFVKPEYSTYVKLCLLLDVDFEFDCLYFLADKKYKVWIETNTSQLDWRLGLYKTMIKYCKNYGIFVDHIEDLDSAISYNVTEEFKILSSFKEIKSKLSELHNKIINNENLTNNERAEEYPF